MSNLARRTIHASIFSLHKPTMPSTARLLTTTTRTQKWKGSTSKDHIANEADNHNVLHDAEKGGKKDRAEVERSRSVSEQSGGSNQKAKAEFPEAPDTVGMQDERGQKKGDA